MWGKKTKTTPELSTKLLKDEKALADIIIDGIDDGIVLLDETGAIRKFNPAAALITGWNQGEAIGLDWKLVFKFVDDKNEAVDPAATAMGKALSGGKSERDNTANLINKENNTVAINVSVSPLEKTSELATTSPLVAIFSDVSKQRQEENQRAEFISTASHEMRTPVAAIEGYLALALNDKVASIDDRARNYLDKAHASTQHLGQLFQDLLTSAKAEDGRLTSHPQVIEMGEFLEQLTEELRFAADKKGLGVEFTVGSNQTIDASSGNKVIKPLFFVMADPDRLKEVITNLFDNACKYTEEGKITLGLNGNTSVVQAFVRDTGSGIPKADIPHLFQKFYRVDNSATRTIGGTGLGLFICRKIIELYKGQIWADSEEGHGSTFYINLPRLSSEDAEKAKAGVDPSKTQLAQNVA